METETMKMKVDLQDLMLQATKEMRSMPVAVGFSVAQGCLLRIAQRAIELNDEALLEELRTLCLIKGDK